MGSPASPEETRPYLKRLFSDPAVLRIPFVGPVVRPPLSSYLARKRAPVTAARMQAIGGTSPLGEITRMQAVQLHAALETGGDDFRVAPAMRYSDPDLRFSFDALVESGCARVVACPLYPQYCKATTGSAFKVIRRHAKRRHPGLPVMYIRSYHDHPFFVEALKITVEEALSQYMEFERDYVVVVFSAHSVPVGLLRGGDPYLDQVRRTAELVAQKCNLRHWRLSFQSRGGALRWAKPSTADTLRMLASIRARNVVLVPVSFVSDNLETLYDMDVELKNIGNEIGLDVRRAAAVNTNPFFTRALADIIKAHLKSEGI